MPHDSIHIDKDGVSTSIRQLIGSDSPRQRTVLPVELMWGRFSCKRRWGDHLPAPARLISCRELATALAQLPSWQPICYEDTCRDHANRIAQLVNHIRSGGEIEPLVIGPDGDLWDGMHRLAALYLLREKEVKVDVFCEGLLEFETFSISDILHPDMQKPANSRLIAKHLSNAVPFPHLYLPSVLQPAVATAIYKDLDVLPWRLAETEFYQQFEVSLFDCPESKVGRSLSALRQVALREEFSKWLSCVTDFDRLRIVDVACHRSEPGQSIGIHTDYSESTECVRLTLHFNECWLAQDGGYFSVFSNEDPASVCFAYPPKMNTAVLFIISERSFHAVTRIEGDRVRYSIVISAGKE